jgi:hypothetical protein
MRRSTLILLAIAVVLAAVLVIQRIDFSAGPPTIGAWDGTADKIIIEKQKEKIVARKSSEGWTLTDHDYPANTQKIDRILNALRDIGEVEVVSTRSDEYDRYELTGEKAQKVTVYAGDTPLRELYLGKSSTVAQKAYARQAGKDRVFLVDRNVKRALDTSVGELRNKTVAEISPKKLKQIEISAPAGTTVTLVRAEEAKSADGNSDEESGKKEQAPADSWRVEGIEKDVSAERINAFFRTVTPLSATSFDTGEPRGEPVGTLRFALKEGGEQTVSIYHGGKKGLFPATASTVPYPFLLSRSDVEALALQLPALLPQEEQQQS